MRLKEFTMKPKPLARLTAEQLEKEKAAFGESVILLKNTVQRASKLDGWSSAKLSNGGLNGYKKGLQSIHKQRNDMDLRQLYQTGPTTSSVDQQNQKRPAGPFLCIYSPLFNDPQ